VSLRFLDASAAAALAVDWPDVYFAPGYGEAAEISDGARWEVALWEPGPILQPVLWRPVDPALTAGGPPAFDLVSPYGYAGVWSPEAVPDAAWRAFREALRTEARSRGAVAEFLRLGGPVAGGTRLAAADPDAEVVHHTDTVEVLLSGGYDAWWTGAQGRCRTSIRKAHKCGWSAVLRPAGAADLASGSSFRQLYEDTMRRVGAGAYYLFPDGYYERLSALLGDRLLLVEARREDTPETVGAASLFMRWGDRLHYHLSGSIRDAGREGANNLVLETAIRWACERGLTSLHLGGGLGAEEDALLKFKLSFGGRRLPFLVSRAILDAERYESLVEAHAAGTGRSRDELMAGGYFPTYRA
jgi:hypothetical protein